ncbi:signal peptidase II [Alloscardovia venturai]|uniref:Lipoprotein signal peptidase n=1 Tax=Alloscardovia venturai TaxID=1769421 RepID=A0ABW2Y4M3_9BIFI
MTVFVSVLLVLVTADQATKALAKRFLTPQSDISVIGHFIRLTLLHNSGATMSIGATRTWVISLFAILASVCVMWIGLKTQSLWWAITAGMTSAGALGNVIDRIVYAHGFIDGAVVDFINYGPFVGNVADIVLTIAAIAIVVGVLRAERFGITRIDRLLYSEDAEKSQHEKTEPGQRIEENGRNK